MPNQPNPYDAVYGGPPISPHDGVVLGGLDGVRQQLSAPDKTVRVAALSPLVVSFVSIKDFGLGA